MARNYYGGKPPKKEAFSNNVLSQIHNAIYRMASAQLRLFQQPFTTDELARMFVPAEHRQLLKDAYRLAAPRGFIYDFNVAIGLPQELQANTLQALRFTWDRSTHADAFLPLDGQGTDESSPLGLFMEDCDPELVMRFVRCFHNLADVSYRWGMVGHVLSVLNASLRTPAQVRYIWPCLVTLLRKAGLNDMASELAEPSVRAGESATIPPGVWDWIKPSNDTVARSQLIEQDQYDKVPKLPVRYTLRAARFHGKFTGTT